MTKYYFVGAMLPDLTIGIQPEITFAEFDALLRLNLKNSDYQLTRIYRRYWDIRNVYALWTGDELDPRGNLSERGLGEALLATEDLPPYVQDYLIQYETKEERIAHFPELIQVYFREESKKAKGILKEVLRLERELRLTLACFRAKKLGRDIAAEVQLEDPEDPFVAQLLAYKDAKTFEPPERFESLKPIFEAYSDSPMELHQALYEFTFQELNQIVGTELFTIERLIIYMVQLIMAEKWMELDKKKGLQIVDSFVKEKA